MIFGDDKVKDTRPEAADADAQLLTLLRIYDTLMAMYNRTDPEGADRLLELHRQGGLGSPIPHFNIKNLLSE